MAVKDINRRKFFGKIVGASAVFATAPAIDAIAQAASGTVVVEVQTKYKSPSSLETLAFVNVDVYRSNGESFKSFQTDSNGQYFLNISITGVDDKGAQLPKIFKVYNPYPQSRSGKERIRNVKFDLYKNSDVKLELFNILGETVAIKEGYLQSGNHEATFDFGNLATGYYRVRVTADGMSDVKNQIWTGAKSIANPSFTDIRYQAPSLAKIVADPTITDYYTFVATKEGYVTVTREELIEPDEEAIELCFSPERFLEAYVIDNQTLEGKVGVVKIGDEEYVTDENGYIKIELFEKTPEQLENYIVDGNNEITSIKELKTYTIDPRSEERNSFIYTRKDVETKDDLEEKLLVTTYDGLNTSPELFKKYAQEGNFNLGNGLPEGLKGIDFSKGKDYTFLILRESLKPGYEFTETEQQYIKEYIERELYSKLDEHERPEIRIAESGERPGVGEDGHMKYGTILVMKGQNPAVSVNDKDGDGIFETANITVVEGNETHMPSGEAEIYSAFAVPHQILSDELRGTTRFHEQEPTSTYSGNDNKLIFGLVRNIDYYGAKANLDDLLGLE
jgi:hypothetical protein